MPLWTPNLFMGVPLLANVQVSTFYPTHWLTSSLTAPEALRLNILIHVGWALLGTYALARRAVGLDRIAALAAAAIFTFGGHVLAHTEQINQLESLSWMPWLFLWLHQAIHRPAVYTPLLAVALALQVFSGHTQAVFISGVGLVLYGLLVGRWHFVPVLLVAGALALLLAAPQLVPALELTDLSNRRGGFNPNQATAFSFSPLVMGRGLLPSYDTPIFGEYVAYPGIFALGLALVGLFSARQRAETTQAVHVPEGFTQLTHGQDAAPLLPWYRRRLRRSPRLTWAVIALVGLLLAFGLYNPVYWWLASLPGFNLFRVPARWLALFALGVALLAGLGLQALRANPRRLRWPLLVGILVVIAGLAALSPFAQRLPEPVPLDAPTRDSFIGWSIAAAGLIALLLMARRFPRVAVVFLTLGIVVELFAASQTMPFNDLTAPEAYTAPRLTIDQLRAYHHGEIVPGRVLGISGLFFDPGDRAWLEARYAEMGLSPEAVRLAFVAIKMKEVLAPNLPLEWGIPSIDGFDGGLLPTGYYTAFTSLLLPDGTPRTLDGRIGEILTRPPCEGACIPDLRWLNLTNTRYLITDKVYDLWHEDVAYDTQFAVSITPQTVLSLAALPDFQATALHVLHSCLGPDCSLPQVEWTLDSGETVMLTPSDALIPVDRYQLARYEAPEPTTPAALRLTADRPITVRALTLVDTRTGDFVQLTPPPWTRLLSSDIKLYENGTVMPRAFVVHQAQRVADSEPGTEDALDLLRDPAFDPLHEVVLSGNVPPLAETGDSSAAITAYSAERVTIAVDAAAEGYLVLTDAHYPGWLATVNGEAAPIVRADVMFRAVRVPAGHSEVVFEYRPAWLPGALVAGAVGWLLVAVYLVARRVLTHRASRA